MGILIPRDPWDSKKGNKTNPRGPGGSEKDKIKITMDPWMQKRKPRRFLGTLGNHAYVRPPSAVMPPCQ